MSTLNGLTVPTGTLYAHAIRIVDPQPRGIRWLERADGTKVLQFARIWSQGCSGGFEWVDVPTVKEGEQPA